MNILQSETSLLNIHISSMEKTDVHKILLIVGWSVENLFKFFFKFTINSVCAVCIHTYNERYFQIKLLVYKILFLSN